jgi:hypothetical protein
MQNVSDQYRERCERFSAEASAHRKRYDGISMLRLASFFSALAVLILLWGAHWVLASGFFMIFLGGFYRLVLWHQGILGKAENADRIAKVNSQELQVLDHRFSMFPPGSDYLHQEHPYVNDLDIFGEHSFFRYCCRATTTIGQKQLAEYLLQVAAPAEITARQQAIAELTPLLDWRQNFQALGGAVANNPHHLKLLHAWMQDADFVRGNRLLTAALYLAPLWFLLCLTAWIFFVSWKIFLLLLVPTAFLLYKTNQQVSQTHLRTTYAADMLAQYARLLEHIERQPFQTSKLSEGKSSLHANGKPASRHIRRLAYIIRQLNVRYNFFAIFLNLMALWDLHWVLRLEKWRASQWTYLTGWFDTLQTFEALSSFANPWYNNPRWVMPEITTGEHLEAIDLGHPLIHRRQRVGNDLTMCIRGHIQLITGSNMAGKSTLLRTVGLNAVLAQAGAPVCAQKFSLPPMQIHTSMRTQDALHENASSFYAELKRLKIIIEAVRAANDAAGLPVFFLLDEILKGTNSVDRHTGSEALIRQLIRLRGGGLIATHDLELGRLEAESNGAIQNRCMEVEIRDKALHFDYKLRQGVSKSFNATLLMRQMGIEVE